MGKTLLNKIGNAIKRSALIGLASLSFAACQPSINPIPEKTNYAPTAIFSSSQTAVKIGEKVSLTLDGKDDNGKQDIVEYEIGEDNNNNNQIDAGEELVKQSSPITDYSFIPNSIGTVKFIGKCTDSKGLTGTANLEITVSDNAVIPPVEPIIQANSAPTVTMSSSKTAIKVGESIQIKFAWEDKDGNGDIVDYNFWLDKNGNDKMDAGEELLNQSTSFTDYTFTPTAAGNFKFMAEDKDKAGLTGRANLEITASNSDLPTVDLSSVDKTLIEGETKTITLPFPTDDDTSGDIPYIEAESLDGKTNNFKFETVNGKPTLTLTANSVNQDTNCQVKLTFGTQQGGINNATLEETIKNLCDITGNIQNVETLATQAGEVRLYDSSGNRLGEKNTIDGNFTIQASSPVSQIKLQAMLSGGSYVRTITFDGTKDIDLTNKIRVVPYPNFDTNNDGSINLTDYQNFKEFMREINISQTLDEYGKELGLSKWNLDNLLGIEVLNYNPNDSNSTFTDFQQQAVINRLSNPSDIPLFINNKKNLGLIIQQDFKDNQNSNKHYDSSGNPYPGWIIVVPDNSIPDAGETRNWYLNNLISGIINGSRIRIRPEHAIYNDPVLTHEFGHAFIAPDGEATQLPSSLTIMHIDFNIFTPGVADEKAGKIVYEDTYLPREKLDDILGLNWIN